ncbi:hypothetical protein Bca52824_003568 [Brassica carinata]|uniref:Clp R domain-containing protein n=1 Tax=Brassica carinata TaxID=52824 RepID=A0A8X7WK65_BRACI|nr:hypothetical protein Bca52824_003568 [Brassica carinata]
MPTAVNVAKQCLTTESSYALEEAVNVARRRGHSQTTSLHAVSALLSLPTSVLRDACARVRNSAYSPRLQFKALDLCLSVSLDRIQSGHQQPGSDDPPVSNSLMAAIKRSQAHQRRLPESFRLYQEMSQSQNSSSLSCVKVELRQLILSILDDPVVSRVFGEAGFRSSELKLSIIRPIPHLFRYSSPRGQQQPLFLCNVTGNHTEPELNPVRWGFTIPNRTGDSSDHRRISDVLMREKARNPLLVGVSAYGVLTDFLNSLENRIAVPTKLHGLTAVNIGSEISDQVTVKFDKTFIDARFRDLGKVAEQGSGPGLVLNYGDLRVFITDGEGNVSPASYIVSKVSELLRRSGGRVWLIGATASNDVYEKMVREFPNVEKDWDLQLLTITTTLSRPCSPRHKSSLTGSFVPFGGFFSTPFDIKLPFSGYNKEITGPVSSVSDQTQCTLPPWLQMTTITDLHQKSCSKTKEGLESVCGTKSTSSASASTGSAKSVTTDLNLRMCPVTTRFGRSASSSCLDNPRDLNAESFKIIYQRLTNRVSGQDEAAGVISCALSQPPKTSTRRDVWLNLVGPDSVGKRRMSLVLAEIVYQSEHRFMPVDLGVADHGMRGCDDVMRLRGKTMVDHIFEVMCRNPFCVVFLENIDKADEKLQVSLSKAIETGKFMDSHGREVGIGNTTFVMTSSSVQASGTVTTSSEEQLLRAKGRKLEIRIETASCLSSEKKRKIGLGEPVETVKRLNRTTNGVLDLNLPAQETEAEETYHTEENSKLWLVNLKKHDRLVEVPFKHFDFEGLAERIKKILKETFAKCVRSDCLLEIDTKIMERLLTAVYFSDNRKDIIKELMEKVMARVLLHVKERYEITSGCVVKLVGRDLDVLSEDEMDLFLVKSQ